MQFEIKDPELPNFIECATVEEANRVDMTKFRLVGFYESRGYVFAKRMK